MSLVNYRLPNWISLSITGAALKHSHLWLTTIVSISMILSRKKKVASPLTPLLLDGFPLTKLILLNTWEFF